MLKGKGEEVGRELKGGGEWEGRREEKDKDGKRGGGGVCGKGGEEWERRGGEVGRELRVRGRDVRKNGWSGDIFRKMEGGGLHKGRRW